MLRLVHLPEFPQHGDNPAMKIFADNRTRSHHNNKVVASLAQLSRYANKSLATVRLDIRGVLKFRKF